MGYETNILLAPGCALKVYKTSKYLHFDSQRALVLFETEKSIDVYKSEPRFNLGLLPVLPKLLTINVNSGRI